MVTQQKSQFLKIRDFLTSYVSFSDERFADICALWAMGTHVYRRFDSFGYLIITAATKRAGKSVLAELLSMVSHDAKMGTSMTASVMRRLVSKGSTLFFDEAESLNSEAASNLREFLNVGYRAGQMIYVSSGPEDVIAVPCYAPKCFILIGDVNDTLRDRSITIEMMRGKAPKVYRRSEAEMEAGIIQGTMDRDNGDSELTDAIDSSFDGEIFDAFDVKILEGREAEVWTPILSLAKAFCPDRLNAIISCAADLASMKMTTDKRTFSEIRKTSEGDATDITFSEFALRDLMSVFAKKEDRLSTAVAIERMKAIPTAPWRTYKGSGLDADSLGELMKQHFAKNTKTGKRNKSIRIGSKVIRGFYRRDVEAAFKRMGKE